MKKKEEVGLVIRTLRLSHNMTQAEVARKIHQSPSSITMYENGRRAPDFETLEALADLFNVPLSTLMDDFPVPPPRTTEARILAAGIDQLPPDDRKKALDMMKLMFSKYAHVFERDDDDEA